jgi:deazaflavin-dependent oxidoreductase (nitroreductase family)
MTSTPGYIPSPRQWVREQVELYEGSGGTQGTTLRETGLPVIIVTHTGNKTGAIRKTPLMRVKDGANYILVGSVGGAPNHPVWVYNLRANPAVEIRDHTQVQAMRVREVDDEAERARLWKLAVATFPPTRNTRPRPRGEFRFFSPSRCADPRPRRC